MKLVQNGTMTPNSSDELPAARRRAIVYATGNPMSRHAIVEPPTGSASARSRRGTGPGRRPVVRERPAVLDLERQEVGLRERVDDQQDERRHEEQRRPSDRGKRRAAGGRGPARRPRHAARNSSHILPRLRGLLRAQEALELDALQRGLGCTSATWLSLIDFLMYGSAAFTV